MSKNYVVNWVNYELRGYAEFQSQKVNLLLPFNLLLPSFITIDFLNMLQFFPLIFNHVKPEYFSK